MLPPGSALHFANHSCDPNVWYVGAYDLVARRTIRAGDELTTDYGTYSGLATFAMDCRCRSVSCRGTVTGEDWRRVELQRRYGSHWVPALLERIGSSHRQPPRR